MTVELGGARTWSWMLMTVNRWSCVVGRYQHDGRSLVDSKFFNTVVTHGSMYGYMFSSMRVAP